MEGSLGRRFNNILHRFGEKGIVRGQDAVFLKSNFVGFNKNEK
jgi:hypothetical protein